MSFFEQITKIRRKYLFASKEDVAWRYEVLNARCTELQQQLTHVQDSLENISNRIRSTIELEVLEGTPYSRYAIPLEYPPSRDFRPRWGHSTPPIDKLLVWFEQHSTSYKDFLEFMRSKSSDLIGTPKEFDEKNLPEPAWQGVPYAPFDAIALYSMIHKYRPKTYLEIGSGITTCFAHKAIRNAKLETKIISIDPEPRAKIDAICDTVIRQGLETCDLSIFDTLEAGDILFFDGSHRSYMNSDVTVLMIDVLPKLKPGVIIHVHDITLPWDYDGWVKNWYWNEQYILAVYLMSNLERIGPLLPTAFICRDDMFTSALATPFIDDLGQLDFDWRGGGAIWFTHR